MGHPTSTSMGAHRGYPSNQTAEVATTYRIMENSAGNPPNIRPEWGMDLMTPSLPVYQLFRGQTHYVAVIQVRYRKKNSKKATSLPTHRHHHC